MNVLNRILVVLSILIWLGLCVALVVDPLMAIDMTTQGIEQFKSALFDSQFYMYYVIGVAVLVLILLLLLWLELKRPRKRTAKIKIKGGGNAQLEIASVAQSLEYRIDELAGVRKVHPRITSRGRDVDVRVDLDTSPSVNIPVLTAQIVDLAHDIIEGQLGVKIHGKVQINVKHEPYPRGTMPSTGPLGDQAVAPPPSPAPAVQRPVVEQPVASEPVVSEPIYPEPVVSQPIAPPVAEPRPVVITPSLTEEEEPEEDAAEDEPGSDW